MRHLGNLLLCIVLALAAGCPSRRGPNATPPRPAGAETVYLYVQPLDPRVGGLRAEIGGVFAVDLDGEPRAFEIRNGLLDGELPRRQRLLALGALPPGRYRGLSFRTARASVERGAVRSDLVLVEAPYLVEHPFTVIAGRAVILTLRLEAERAIVEGHAFEPAFTVGAPSTSDLAPAAVALATVAGRDALIVFNRRTGEVFDVYGTGRDPRGVAYDAARRRAYVACAGSDTVEAFDLVRGAREQTLPLQFGDRPNSLSLTRDGRTLVVVHPGSNSLSVLDAPTLAERFRLNVGREPTAAIFGPADRRVFVFQQADDSVAMVDLAQRAVVASLPMESEPVYGALARDGRELWVIHRDSAYLTRVDLERFFVERGPYVGIGAEAIAIDPRTDRVFLARRGTAAIEVFDPGSELPIETIGTGSDAAFLSIDDDSEELYVLLPDPGRIETYRLSGRRLDSSTDVGGRSYWLDVARSGP